MSKAPLPKSASDIDPSDIRQNALSSDELRKIRSLIDVAKGGTSKQTASSQTSCQPLTGRRVMVPVTSKAFFEGVLQPPAKDSGSAADEQIVVNIGGGKIKEMTRVEACTYLEKQQVVLDKSTANKTSKSKPTNTSFKKGFLNNSKSKTSVKKSMGPQNKTAVNQDLLSQEAMFPLMEIREECDVRGNIVNSEVINMSNTLRRIDDRLKNEGDIDQADGDGEKLRKLLAGTLQESEAAITTELDTFTLEEDQAVKDAVDPTKLTPVSDEDYEVILQRLEELERLEEEDTKSKKVNKTSSTRLQSSGWSKGFLNASTKGKKNVRKKKEVKLDTNVKVTPSKQQTLNFEDAQVVRNNQKVSFASNNEIKEIPRIGLNKVPQRSIPNTPPPPAAAVDPSSILDTFTPVSTVPFEDNVFRGVVKERISPVVKANDQTVQDAGAKKRLSRFAQQRQQRE